MGQVAVRSAHIILFTVPLAEKSLVVAHYPVFAGAIATIITATIATTTIITTADAGREFTVDYVAAALVAAIVASFAP